MFAPFSRFFIIYFPFFVASCRCSAYCNEDHIVCLLVAAAADREWNAGPRC